MSNYGCFDTDTGRETPRRAKPWTCERCLVGQELQGHRCYPKQGDDSTSCYRRVCCLCFNHLDNCCTSCFWVSNGPPPTVDIVALHMGEIIAEMERGGSPVDDWALRNSQHVTCVGIWEVRFVLNIMRRQGTVKRVQRKGDEYWVLATPTDREEE